MWIQKAFAPFKAALPRPLANALRSLALVVLAPHIHYYRSGFIRSSFYRKAVDRHGRPLPWYTYSAIDFLSSRDFTNCRILEFGAGQSTLWWAARAQSVVSLEDDPKWFAKLTPNLPPNVHLVLLEPNSGPPFEAAVAAALSGLASPPFDIVVVDGLPRNIAAKLSYNLVSAKGAIVCDNSEGYGIASVFAGSEFDRADFYGAAPGVILKHCTSIYFRAGCFVFNNRIEIRQATID
jgi:hypothetical protein